MLSIFVSGLEKQTGKTLVTAGLAATMQSLAYRTAVYKPIQTFAKNVDGLKSSPDLSCIKLVDPNITTHSTYLISSPHSPFVGAYEDKVSINPDTIYSEFRLFSNSADCIIVEGCNSIASPIVENVSEIDIVRNLRLPLVLVVNPSKMSLDSAIAGLNYVIASKVNLLGVIINQYNENSQNLEEKYFPQILKEFTNVKILGTLPDYGDAGWVAPEVLISEILNNLNIEEIFGLKIAKLNV